jgi:hypothetical protein
VLSLVSACFSAWRKERLTVETLSAQIVPHQRRKEVRDHLSRSLNAIDKFVRVINDPHQLVPINHIDQWEVETCIYLRENLSEADENFFMSETGAPPVPEYGLIEERARQLRRLHYHSYQLRKILDRLSLTTP